MESDVVYWCYDLIVKGSDDFLHLEKLKVFGPEKYFDILQQHTVTVNFEKSRKYLDIEPNNILSKELLKIWKGLAFFFSCAETCMY